MGRQTMDLKPFGTDFSALVQALSATHQQLQAQAARSVDTALVLRNWLFGWHLVEFENASAKRQEVYGKNLVDKLSAALISQGIKGVSPTNLRLCRSFYESFQKIQQTASVESSAATPQPPDLNALKAQLGLGWSHYVVLLSVSNTHPPTASCTVACVSPASSPSPCPCWSHPCWLSARCLSHTSH